MHILKKPELAGFIFIPELKYKIRKAFIYASNNKIEVKQQPEGTFIYLNDIVLDDTDTIIQLELL